MSRNGVPTASDHEEQIAIARQFQAERGPVRPPRSQNRYRGRTGGKAHEANHTTKASFGNRAPASYGGQVTSRPEPSTLMATTVNHGTSSTRRAGGGGGLSSSIWAGSISQDYVPPHLRDREVPTSTHDSTACNDPMEVDQPATTAASAQSAQPATGSSPFASGSAGEGSVSKNSVAEKSILDEDVPLVENWENVINPIKIPTMLPRDGGLRTSRWAPRYTLDGREIED